MKIGALEETVEMEIYQPSREEAVLKHVRETNAGPLDSDAIARLFERIIDEARRLERVVQEREGNFCGAHKPRPASIGAALKRSKGRVVMVVVMEERATEEQIQSVVAHLVDMGFDVHRSTGALRTVVGAVGGGRQGDPRLIEVLDGVHEVLRITEPYKLGQPHVQT